MITKISILILSLSTALLPAVEISLAPEKALPIIQDRQDFQTPDRVQLGGWIGTRLGWAALDKSTHHPIGDVATLVGGWGHDGPIVGRITDVAFAPDGRLFFSDDQGGGIYWVAPRTLLRPEHR